MKEYGWTADYLLWGIAWINVQLIQDDSARVIEDNPANPEDGAHVEKRELKTKEDIRNYLRGML